MISVKSYLPPEKRVRSKLQQVKDKHRSFTQTNKEGIPKDLNELKEIKYREHAITFLNQYTNINKKMSKSQYCKTNHISHKTLNTALQQLGYKTQVKEPKQTQLEPVKPKQTQLNPIKKTKTKSKPLEIKGGNTYTEFHSEAKLEDEELNEIVNNSFCKLSTS